MCGQWRRTHPRAGGPVPQAGRASGRIGRTVGLMQSKGAGRSLPRASAPSASSEPQPRGGCRMAVDAMHGLLALRGRPAPPGEARPLCPVWPVPPCLVEGPRGRPPLPGRVSGQLSP